MEHFLAGDEFSLDASVKCMSFLLTQAVDEETAINLPAYIHLTYDENGLLSDANIYYTDDEEEVSEHLIEYLNAKNAIGKMKYRNWPIHTSYSLVRDKKGIHQIGGELPTDLLIPKNNLIVPFQYLGFIDNKDEAFNWLPFKLHLICPIFLNFEFLFLDYTNPLNPTIINQAEFEQSDTSYEKDLNKETEIVYEVVRFSTEATNDYGFGVGNAGIPKWIQHPDIPLCPKTNNAMRFLCQSDGDGIKAKRTNVVPHDEFYRNYYEKLNFWGDGELFVFFEPTSKVACYFIQNT